jgi:hypothetical protein
MVLGFSRFDKKTSFKQRCSAVVLFDYQTGSVDTAEYALNNHSSWGEPGVVYAADPLGLKVTGFVTGSSAASSGLKIGDVIIEVRGELLMGLSSALAFEKMAGDRDTEVALTAIRKNPTTGGKERISTHILRDVGKELRTGFYGLEYLSGGLTVGALLFTAFGLLDGSGNEAMSSILLAVLVALFLFSLGPAQSCARCTTTVAAVAAAKKAAADAKVVTLVNIRQSVCVVREIFVPGNGKS